MTRSTVEDVDALLPQVQCTRCGYGGCAAYAQAVVADEAAINRCPPGGAATMERIASLMGRVPLPLDPDCGVEAPRRVARIEEGLCIGCTLCLRACPVDAILGAPKLMHTVLTELCTGCDLCLAPCPMDCIVMDPVPAAELNWTAEQAMAARERFDARNERLARNAQAAPHADSLREKPTAGMQAPTRPEDDGRVRHESIKATVSAAIERARARRRQLQRITPDRSGTAS